MVGLYVGRAAIQSFNRLYSVQYRVSSALFSPSCKVATMRFSTQVKSISYLKANAADMLDKLAQQREPVLITQNGEATAVMQDIATYETDQQALALLKILALGNHQIEQGKVIPAARAIAEIRKRRAKAGT